jgi:uncharacterized protein with HEPN domain
MNESDLVRLRHMLEAAQTALVFTENETRESLDNDLKLVFAIIRAVEIIGEAATKVSTETREQYPEIEWKGITGMRHVLAHDYFKVNLDRVWNTVTIDLPELIALLEPIIRSVEGGGSE